MYPGQKITLLLDISLFDHHLKSSKECRHPLCIVSSPTKCVIFSPQNGLRITSFRSFSISWVGSFSLSTLLKIGLLKLFSLLTALLETALFVAIYLRLLFCDSLLSASLDWTHTARLAASCAKTDTFTSVDPNLLSLAGG
jgi:hypothetical protein